MTYKPSARAEILTRRTYNRPKDADGIAFETWEETIDRVISHQKWLWERAKGQTLNRMELQELEDLRKLMLERKSLSSGRTLWLGGTDVARTRESSMFNCSFLRIETVHDVVDALWLLLQGCGVGFEGVPGILNGFTKSAEIRVIRSTKTDQNDKGYEHNREHLYYQDGLRVWELVIGDSAEAWAKAAGKLMAMKHAVDVIVLNFREIRPAGVRLRGYGWISSGDEQIAKAFERICGILNIKAGKLLDRIDILDVVNWLGTILSSRRSAEIAIMDVTAPEIDQFIVAKKDFWLNGNEHRQQSNNSILFHKKPTKWELGHIFQKIKEAGGSEPGFINAEAATKRAPWFKGVNPCAEILLGSRSFCVSGETKLITEEGITSIKDAVGKDIKIWNGKRWASVKPFKTGDNDKLLRVDFGDGSYLDVTPEHRFFVKDRFGKEYKEVLAKDLMTYSKYTIHTEPFTIQYETGTHVDNAYTLGFFVGDGSNTYINVYTEEKRKLPLAGVWSDDGYQNGMPKWRLHTLPFDVKIGMGLKHSLEAAFSWDKDSIINFVSGLADADGSNTKEGGIRIYQANEGFCRDLQLLLTKVGIRSSVNFMTAAPSNFGERKPIFYVQISDTTKLACHRLKCTYKSKGNKGQQQTVVSVTPLEGTYESFCFSEPETTKGVFGNSLTGQCNLVETDINKFNGDFDNLLNAIRLVARANYRQTCVHLDDGILQRSWHELNEFLHLCGVGVTGIVGWEYADAPWAWQKLKHAAINGADSMADELGLPRAKLVTTVKPSGTLGKIMDTTEGVHKPLGKYIFNNVKFSKHDPLVDILRNAGYRVFEAEGIADAYLVTLPVAYESVPFDNVDGMEVNLESAVTQLERYKMLMQNYVQHNCSITISYDESEVTAIIDWLLENWDTYVGVSFIYRNDPTKTAKDLGYTYLPQEIVTKERYYAYVNTLRDIDLDAGNTLVELEQEACATGACPIR